MRRQAYAWSHAGRCYLSHPQQGITIGNQSYLPRADQSVKIYDGLSWDQVQKYFLELTGAKELPVGRKTYAKDGSQVGTIWTVADGRGGTYTLRDFASSSGQSGPVWTIEVPKSLVPNATTSGKSLEVKFGKPTP